MATSPMGYDYTGGATYKGGANGISQGAWNKIQNNQNWYNTYNANGEGLQPIFSADPNNAEQNIITGYRGVTPGSKSSNLYDTSGSFTGTQAINQTDGLSNEMLAGLAAAALTGGIASGFLGAGAEGALGATGIGAEGGAGIDALAAGAEGGAGAAEAASPYSLAGGSNSMIGPGLSAPNTGFFSGLGTSAGLGGGSEVGGLAGLLGMGKTAVTGLAGISSLYDWYARNKMANAQIDQMNQQRNAVNNLYSPGSPEYNLLAEKIARSNAASGRNSQVGQFSTDLAGQIAQIKAGALTQGLSAQNNILNQSLQNRYGGLNSLFFNLLNSK